MRKAFITCAVAVIGLVIAAFATPPAQAMTIAAPAVLGKVIHGASLVEGATFVCRGGWRRCGRTARPYSGYYPPNYAYSFYRPEPYYAYGYYQLRSYPAWWWGWRQPWWW
jgi:hypothetical protein